MIKPELKKNVNHVIKTVWIAVIFLCVLFFLIRHWEYFIVQISLIGISSIIFSITLIILGKAITATLLKDSLNAFDVFISNRKMFYVYCFSDIAKYVPIAVGGIIGRISMYIKLNLDKKTIASSLLLENVWLISSAFLIGMALLIPTWAIKIVDTNNSNNAIISTISIGLIITLWYTIIYYSIKFISKPFKINIASVIYMFSRQLMMWFFFGLSFHILANHFINIPKAMCDIGAFSIAYGVGAVALFAPAGVGVREGIVAIILHSQYPLVDIVGILILHRICWFIADLLMLTIVRFVCIREN